MAVSGNPRDPQTPRHAPRFPAIAPSPAGFRSPAPDRAPLPGELDPESWLERFDRDLADALEDSQFELDEKVTDWPQRHAGDGSED